MESTQKELTKVNTLYKEVVDECLKLMDTGSLESKISILHLKLRAIDGMASCAVNYEAK